MTRADRDADAILSANQSRADEQRWTMGVQLVLDWTLPLEVLRPRYERAAELAVERVSDAQAFWRRAQMRDPFGEEP